VSAPQAYFTSAYKVKKYRFQTLTPGESGQDYPPISTGPVW